MLVIKDSGTQENPIVIGSYPDACANKPGSIPIAGWSQYRQNIYVADLSTGNNQLFFPNGINQLFMNGNRLPFGRWPNLVDGYSTIDFHEPLSAQITDNELPQGNWTNARIHMKGSQWHMMIREITTSNNQILTLNHQVDCFADNRGEESCTGCGFFINNHLQTLDTEGEWYFDRNSNRVYLYTKNEVPIDNLIEGSVILTGKNEYDTVHGAIVLGKMGEQHIQNVVVTNLKIQNWFSNGITTPSSLEIDDNNNIQIHNNYIKNVQGSGINLMTYIWNAGENSSMRGGDNILVSNNIIEGANTYGILSWAIRSRLEHNQIRDTGLIRNLSGEGIGCNLNEFEECTNHGTGINILTRDERFSGTDTVIEGNHIQKTGMYGIHASAPRNIIRQNFVEKACYERADCGAIRSYGDGGLDITHAYDIKVEKNIIKDTIGNTDGCRYDRLLPQFGFGIYADHYVRNISVTDNTVINSSAGGILFWWKTTGIITGNILYNNAYSGPSPYRPGNAQIEVWDIDSERGTQALVEGNKLIGTSPVERMLQVTTIDNVLLGIDHNVYFSPYLEVSFRLTSPWSELSFNEWKALSGMDQNSTSHWYTQKSNKPRSMILYNPTNTRININLKNNVYLDIEKNKITGNIEILPYSSIILFGTKPIRPAYLRAKAISPNRILLKWRDRSANEDRFVIERKEGDCFSTNAWRLIATNGANSTSFINFRLAANTIYSYRIKARNNVGESVYSNCSSATTRNELSQN